MVQKFSRYIISHILIHITLICNINELVKGCGQDRRTDRESKEDRITASPPRKENPEQVQKGIHLQRSHPLDPWLTPQRAFASETERQDKQRL